MKAIGKSRRCKAVREWSLKVRERDGFKCTLCNSTDRVQAHHIIAWHADESKRLDLNNGKTLCISCHLKLERGLIIPWIKGKKHTQKTKLKMRKAKLGYIPWNKGVREPHPERKTCVDCNIEKEKHGFTPLQGGQWYSNRCKVCRNRILKNKRDMNGNK